MSLRLVFMGTPDFAVPVLTELVGQGHEIAAVYTRAPKPAGRGLDLQRSSVHRQADILRLPVETPVSLRSPEAAATFAAYEADAAIVVAYGLILPQAILDTPQLGCLNLHASLLPRWRGAAPIQRAVMAGDSRTGVMVMRMEQGLDTGPVAMVEPLAIGEDMTAQDVHDRLMPLGADLMARAVAALSRGALTFKPQAQEGITYAAKITKEEARIDWSRPAQAVHDQIRGLFPFPGAYFELPDGKGRVKVLRSAVMDTSGTPGRVLDDCPTIACGDAALRILNVQRAGKTPMSAADFMRGTPLAIGSSLN